MNVITQSNVVDFLYRLEPSAGAKAYGMLESLAEFGHELGMPHSKSLGAGLFELRIRGKQEVRLLYGFRRDAAYVVHGFIKKTQKIPQRELSLATQYLNRY